MFRGGSYVNAAILAGAVALLCAIGFVGFLFLIFGGD